MINGRTTRRGIALFIGSILTVMSAAGPSEAGIATVKQWVDIEFQPSTLSRKGQLTEMAWFIEASRPFKGMEISVISRPLATHKYEAKTLAKAFFEITGIKVRHDLAEEADLIEKLQLQCALDHNIYDAWITDSDLIGTHFRYGFVVPLSDFMAREGRAVTLPTLDVNDFIGKSFTTGPNGKLYQLPDQQHANLYWFRYDWFTRADLKKKFKAKYGYELGVPLNWSAYEDIAEFFTNDMRDIDGVKAYGHNDYGKNSPGLSRRFTDAWLSMAGTGDKGIPNGKPVDEWGIRVEGCRPVGASVARGGAANGPAAKLALRKYLEWIYKYAPPGAVKMDLQQSQSVLSQGYVAQQIFWYTAFLPEMLAPGPIVNKDGTPKWRMAPSPHGPYWEEGMKIGYQNCGAWTFLRNTPLNRRKAAWLYAQFCVSKSVSLKKMHVGLTPIRLSDIRHASFTDRAPQLGGLVEFYRSPARVAWTPTGANVPDYPLLYQLWWQNIAEAMTGKVTADDAMDNLAVSMDMVLLLLTNFKSLGPCGPKLNEKESETYWLTRPGAPKPKVNERPKGETVDYDQLLQSWRGGGAP